MSVEWLIKTSNGKIQGPFSEEEICSAVENLEFNGEEYISEYPSSGHWKHISSHPVFYDALFKAMSPEKIARIKDTVSAESVKLKTKSNSPADHSSISINKEKSFDLKQSESIKNPSYTKSKTKSKFKAVRVTKENRPEDASIIDMEDSKSVLFKRFVKKLLFFSIIISTFLYAGFLFLSSKKDKKSVNDEAVQLLSPKSGQMKSAQDVVLNKIKQGMSYYLSGQVSNYIQAQTLFVQALEGDPKNKFAMAYLCLTHFELWPFTLQRSKEVQTVDLIAKNIEQIDQGGIYSSLCRSVQHITQDRQELAVSLVKTSIDEFSSNVNPENISPFFYYLRGFIHAHQSKYDQALQDLDYARTLLPNMTGSYIKAAQILQKQKRLNESLKFYSQVLQKHPQHKTALLGKGILMHSYLRQPQGSVVIRKALELPGLVSPSYLAAAYFILARSALQINDSAEFLKYSQKAYALDPSNKELKKLIQKSGLSGKKSLQSTQVNSRLLIEKGDQLSREGSHFEARNHYKQAFQAGKGKNTIAAVKMAESLWRSGLSLKAIEWLQKAVSADPYFVRPYIIMSDYYSQIYEMEKAARALKAANKKAPNNLDVFKGYALLSLKKGYFENTVVYVKKVLEMYESDVNAHILLSKAYYLLGDFKQSLRAAGKAKEIDSNNRQAQIQYARVLGKMYGVSSAFEYFENWIKKSQPGSQGYIDYILALAQFLYDNNRFKNARSILNSISNIKEKPIEYHILLGRIYFKEGKNINLAYEEFLKAALVNPADPEVMHELAQVFMKLQQYDSAESYLKRILDSFPRYPRIHYLIARILVLKGGDDNLNKALKRVQSEIKLNPNLPEAYQLAGDIYETLGKYILCAQIFQKAIEILPNDSELYVRSSSCYRKAGDLDLALQLLRGISESSANQRISNPKVYRELGVIYEMKKDYTNAAKAYSAYLEIMPNAKDKQLIRNRVQNFEK